MTGWVLAEVNAKVAAEHEDRLIAAYRRVLARPLPDGLIQTELLRGPDGSWRVQTLWRDRAAMDAERASSEGTAAPRLFHEIDAAPEFAVFEVVAEWITAEPEGQ
ncbi:antibiotic biosynthesis monooxygenase [Streptacidiphilus sp. MAP5-3]|uniref:antibiotic biosynthesis monooxygenase family protein n=1 Tax=unclassified Streptacidiphilus TaxID=2643834 RepID=UPI003518C3EC